MRRPQQTSVSTKCKISRNVKYSLIPRGIRLNTPYKTMTHVWGHNIMGSDHRAQPSNERCPGHYWSVLTSHWSDHWSSWTIHTLWDFNTNNQLKILHSLLLFWNPPAFLSNINFYLGQSIYTLFWPSSVHKRTGEIIFVILEMFIWPQLNNILSFTSCSTTHPCSQPGGNILIQFSESKIFTSKSSTKNR